MGKILIFKDADWSAVAVDQVSTGVTSLTPTILEGMAIGSNGKISANNAWRVYYVPITAGKKYELKVKWSNAHYQRVGTSTSVPANNTTLSLFINQQVTAEATTTLDYIYVANSNGYLAWQMHIADTISCMIKEWV